MFQERDEMQANTGGEKGSRKKLLIAAQRKHPL
jgi:hypothetical protein